MNTKTPTINFEYSNDEAKLKELMLYIADKCFEDPNFGATKLNKILWWTDFHAFAIIGKPITGVEYQRLENGPAPRRLLPIREEMIESKDACIKKKESFIHTQHRLIPLRSPNLDIFTPKEIDLVNWVIEEVQKNTAHEVSFMSHGKEWSVVKNGDSIPYELAFLSNEPITQTDIARTKEMAMEFEWETA